MIGGWEAALLLGVPVVVMPTQPLPGSRWVCWQLSRCRWSGGFVVVIVVNRSVSSFPVVLVKLSPRASRGWGSRGSVCCCCFRVYWGCGFGGQAENVGDQVAFVEGVVESTRDPWW